MQGFGTGGKKEAGVYKMSIWVKLHVATTAWSVRSMRLVSCVSATPQLTHRVAVLTDVLLQLRVESELNCKQP